MHVRIEYSLTLSCDQIDSTPMYDILISILNKSEERIEICLHKSNGQAVDSYLENNCWNITTVLKPDEVFNYRYLNGLNLGKGSIPILYLKSVGIQAIHPSRIDNDVLDTCKEFNLSNLGVAEIVYSGDGEVDFQLFVKEIVGESMQM